MFRNYVLIYIDKSVVFVFNLFLLEDAKLNDLFLFLNSVKIYSQIIINKIFVNWVFEIKIKH